MSYGIFRKPLRSSIITHNHIFVNPTRGDPIKSWSSLDYILNPTDPDAGTNRINTVSRDNLMNGAGLKYSGYYNGPTTIVGLNTSGGRWSASVSSTDHAYRLDVYTNGRIEPRQTGNKQLGRSVR